MKVEEEDEEGSGEEQEEEEEEENLEKAFSVERFGDIISDSASTGGDRMGRNYTEKDFECKQNLPSTVYTLHLQLHSGTSVTCFLKYYQRARCLGTFVAHLIGTKYQSRVLTFQPDAHYCMASLLSRTWLSRLAPAVTVTNEERLKCPLKSPRPGFVSLRVKCKVHFTYTFLELSAYLIVSKEQFTWKFSPHCDSERRKRFLSP